MSELPSSSVYITNCGLPTMEEAFESIIMKGFEFGEIVRLGFIFLGYPLYVQFPMKPGKHFLFSSNIPYKPKEFYFVEILQRSVHLELRLVVEEDELNIDKYST